MISRLFAPLFDFTCDRFDSSSKKERILTHAFSLSFTAARTLVRVPREFSVFVPVDGDGSHGYLSFYYVVNSTEVHVGFE